MISAYRRIIIVLTALAGIFLISTHISAQTTGKIAGRVLDAETGQPIGLEMRHEAGVGRVRFSHDGRRVATASEDGTARVAVGRRQQAAPCTPNEVTGAQRQRSSGHC